MNKLNKVMLMLIAMVAIMLVAVGIDRGYEYYQDLKWEKERVVAYEQAKAEVEAMQATIQTLSKDPDALNAYIEENELNYMEVDDIVSDMGSELSDETMNEDVPDMSVSVSMSAGSVSDNDETEKNVSDNNVSANDEIEERVSDNSVSDNCEREKSVSGNSVSDNSLSGNATQITISQNDLQVKQRCASYEETIEINKADKDIIAGNSIDFSDVKIACLGDSITAATNLNTLEGYDQMGYPYQLFRILGAEKVVNLGIGGSSIGRYWENAFVDRYKEIPENTDLIVVMGGTNDGFCVSKKELGSLEERKERTFAGDLDELLKGLKEDYPDAEIILVSPLSNVLHDMLRKENNKLLPQSAFTNIMEQLAAEYDVNYIDLYHSNLLDTHDAAIIHNFMPDGVHGNEAGYKILAEHLAAEIIKLYDSYESD